MIEPEFICGCDARFSQLFLRGDNGAFHVHPLKTGIPIGQGLGFVYGYSPLASPGYVWWPNVRVSANGPWANKGGFLGLTFENFNPESGDFETLYGWALLQVHTGRGFIDYSIDGIAYETVSGQAIRAGQTGQDSMGHTRASHPWAAGAGIPWHRLVSAEEGSDE
jgi:hypothetical protein